MRRYVRALLIASAVTAALVSLAFAETTITAIDDVNLTTKVEVAVGEYVVFLNAAACDLRSPARTPTRCM